jgi:phenylalanyl-tRNA synthetase beta chain
MRVPMSWLREYCDPGVDVNALAERLAATGTEVERVMRHGAAADDCFVVGKVVSAQQHPDADRLKVCMVDLGEGEPSQIVCGAPNVAAGQTVAVARPGALMPGGEKLGKAKLRGVESNGMILAEDELEIGGQHAGIMVLDDELGAPDMPAPGTPLPAVLPPGDDVLELEITPNRPDCLGVYGVAREVHALTGAPLRELPSDIAPGGDETFPIEVDDFELCPRFTARVFRDVTVGPSPLWLKARLSAAGMRPINNVVDITNYVMLLIGQPMHAFDMDLIRGGRLHIRNAEPGEKVTTLDDVERECDETMVLVCDGEGPTAIAGIMGGAISEVSETTTNLLLEVATWNGPNIHKTSQKLALRSEASGRFEKGLSPALPLEAQALASRLIVELCGARLVSPTIDISDGLPEAAPIHLHSARVRALLGTDVPHDQSREQLVRLGFGVADEGDDLLVTPPHQRIFDVTREADVIEEIARFRFDELPATLPAAREAVGSLTPAQRLRRRLEDLCRDRGFYEAITWSFTSRELLGRLLPGDGVWPGPLLAIANPLSEEHAVMRPLVLPGLLESAQRNFARGADAVRLFELGKTYSGVVDAPVERICLGAVLCGPLTADSWRSNDSPGDFLALKGVAEAVAAAAAVDLSFSTDMGEGFAWLHPGRSALLVGDDGAPIGWIGELHPLVARDFDLPEPTVVLELDVDALDRPQAGPVIFTPFSEFPVVREDIAVVVSEDVPAQSVVETVSRAAGELLSRAELFDVYRGEQVGEGRVSLAIRLEYSALDRTLTDDEVAQARDAITGALDQIGGALRG